MADINKAETIDLLHFASLTAAINNMKSPNNFLQRLLFGNIVTLPSEKIELSTLEKGREMAPMIKKNGESIMVAGYDTTFATVEAPNIRIRRPFTPSDVLFKRRPGGTIFAGAGSIRDQARQHIARDLQVMADYITNREEWMCAQALQGVISYSVADGENFTVTLPRAATTKLATPPKTAEGASSDFWDNADAADLRPLLDILHVKRVMSDEVGLQPTVCLMGKEASAAFMDLARRDSNFKDLLNRESNVAVGNQTWLENFQDTGALYLGRISGIDFWEYSRTATDENGDSQPMIRDKYAEFIHTGSSAGFLRYYGAIADVPQLQGRAFQTRRFAKSWAEEDPAVLMSLVHTRPLPWIRRPNSVVSMKVVST